MTHSFRYHFYLLAILLGFVVFLWFVNYSGNKAFTETNIVYAHLVELDSQFSRLAARETVEVGRKDNITILLDELGQFARQCGECHTSEAFLPEQRVELLTRRHDAVLKIAELRRETNQRLSELVGSVRFIHEYHIAALKNFIRHNRAGETIEHVDGVWKKGSARSAPEPDIISGAVAIQHRLADITNDFFALASVAEPRQVNQQFKEHTKAFYQAVKTFEDYSLDAQDGLLVEELLDNGRLLESNFLNLIELESSNRQLLAALDENRKIANSSFKNAQTEVQNQSKRLRKRINIVNLVSLIMLALMVLLFFVRSRSIVESIETMVDETTKITSDVSYRIPNHSSTLSEFTVLQNAMNNMAEQLDGQFEKLLQEIQTRRKVEALLSQGKKEWERTFDAVPDMIFILGLDHSILQANQAMLDFFEISSEEITGRKCCEVVHNSDELPSFCKKYLLLNTHLQKNGDIPTCHHHDFYEERLDCHISATICPLLDSAGELTGYVHVMRDVTEQFYLGKQRRTMEKKLQKAEKMEAIGLMAGGVAHDLNNILAGIISYPELMLMDIDEDSRWRESLEMIRDSGFRAAAIVADLLTIARGVACKKENHNLNVLIKQYLATAEFLKLSDRFQQVTVKTELGEDLLNCDCSPIHIQKLLMNLITNGIEAMENQGEMTISTQNEEVIFSKKFDDLFEEEVPGGQYVKIEIADTGSGIPEKDLPRIFEPFYSKKAMGQSGTGLGLAVAWNAVQDHNGFIAVESSPQGTTFIILLPASKKVVISDVKTKSIEHFHGSGKVLVVDDEPLQTDIAEKMLNKLGYTVTTAPNGNVAVEYLNDHKVDLVLLDMIMEPYMNGRKTLERILEIWPDQKTIIITGYAERSEVKKACALGNTELISKPYTMLHLSEKIKMMLAG